MTNSQIGLLEVKNTISKIRNSMDRSINRFITAENQISEWEDRSEENIQNTAEGDNRLRNI